MGSAAYWTTTLKGRDDLEIEVEFSYSGGCAAQTYGPPEGCWPAEDPEIEIVKAYKTEGEGDVVLTDAEREAIETEILEGYEWDEGGDYDDRD